MPCTVYCVPAASLVSQTFADHCLIRYDHHHHNHKDLRKWSRTSAATSTSASAYPLVSNPNDSSSRQKFDQETARDKFTREISFHSKDQDISLAKALLYVAAEDEAFMAYNREMDACSLLNERMNVSFSSDTKEWDTVEQMPLGVKTVSEWLSELDAITKEVEAELVSRDIGCHLVEVLQAVNLVLFELRGFKRSPVLVDSKHSYLHSVLSSGYGSATLVSIIYIEVCRRLGLTIVGSCVGEDFLIWPQTAYPEELFKETSGHSLFAVVNGRCVEDSRSMASDLTGTSLLGLEIATNRDIIGISLANLIRLHWKRASRSNPGLMLTSPLRQLHNTDDRHNQIDKPGVPLLRPQDLRLAIKASERLLILQPHNWALRRDHGMMLYYNREYGKAVQELSICMAFAPEEEAEILQPFVHKLHLMRLVSSCETFGHTPPLTIK
ncbi:uncharacterized protein LOC120128565 [Hibiscus syriacus]|uniref:uncharacterized protein LOC120128565 n=1 Tax=Hibiscus syriacus TaxID=106335 RepID=UPI0019207A17|nr:uncharacterized protein LOC120128565 [Hibiscus syriacus]